MAIKKVSWFNAPQTINENFDDVQDQIDVLEGLVDSIPDITPASPITTIGSTTNITTVPASFAALSDVQSYLAGANVIPNIEARLDQLSNKVDSIITALRNSGVITTA